METIKAIGTKKVCKTGTGLNVYLEKNWGFQCDDMVNITVELVRRPGDGDKGKDPAETGAEGEKAD